MQPVFIGMMAAVYYTPFEIDYMEYATDGAAQNAWVTSGGESIVDYNGTHTISITGDPALSSAQVCGYGSSTVSILFGGTDDYLSIADHADWALGSTFTIDLWFYTTSTATQVLMSQRDAGIPGAGFDMFLLEIRPGTSKTELAIYINGSSVGSGLKDATININTWYHIAWVCTAGTLQLYIDGVATDSSTGSITIPDVTNPLLIGIYNANGSLISDFAGYMDNIRITKGTALWSSGFNLTDAELLYTGSPNWGNLYTPTFALNSFSEPTIKTQGSYALKLSATTDALGETVTKTLTGGDILDLTGKNTIKFDARSTATGGNLEFSIQDVATPGNYAETGNLFVDGQTTIEDENGTHTITVNGNAAVNVAQYCPNGGSSSSIAFDGTGDYLTVPDSTDWNLGGSGGGNNFTIDFWFYTTTLAADSGILAATADGGTNGWNILFNKTGDKIQLYANGGYAIDYAMSSPAINTWYHIAIVRNGTTITLYQNGVSIGDGTDREMDNVSNALGIGASRNDGTIPMSAGYLDNIRVTKGTALWTANFNLTDAELFYAKRQTHTINIASADTYQEEVWDISGVADADKNAIDQLQLKIVGVESNADLINDDCSSLTGWTDGDTGTGASTQETFGGHETFKLTSGGTAGGEADIYKDFGSLDGVGNTIVISLELYCDAIGLHAATDYFRFQAGRSDAFFEFHFASDGLYVYTGAAYIEVGTDLVVQDTWQKWLFAIDVSGGVASATVDTYINQALVSTGDDISWVYGAVDGRMRFSQTGTGNINQTTYVRSLKIGSAFQFAGDHFIDNVRSE